jgi:hypothetical protein
VSVASYASLATSTVTHTFGGWSTITFDPLNLTGFKWDPLVLAACADLLPCPPAPASAVVPGDVASYEVPAAGLAGGAPFLVAGEPAVSFFAATVGHRVQLDVRLLDVAPNGAAALVTRGTLTLDAGAGTPLGMRRVRAATFGNLWEVAADHRLRVEVSNVDSPYLRPSLVPSATAIADVELSIPIRPVQKRAQPAPQPVVAEVPVATSGATATPAASTADPIATPIAASTLDPAAVPTVAPAPR